MTITMRFFLVLCLVAITTVVAKKQKKKERDEYLARQALDQLTYSREEQIYNIALDVPQDTSRRIGMENDVTNVCSFYKCSEGKICIINENNDPSCICATSCPPSHDSNSYICSSLNITYNSKCDFYRSKCVGEISESETLHYFGECRELPPCPVTELQEFPQRLRDWFTNVMLSLANLDEHLGGLSKTDKQLAMDAVHDEHPYVKPVQWKFRSLDMHPQDNLLSQEELMPLRTALIPSEHCASVFFAMCDNNQDLLLNMNEWSNCMGLTPDEMEP